MIDSRSSWKAEDGGEVETEGVDYQRRTECLNSRAEVGHAVKGTETDIERPVGTDASKAKFMRLHGTLRGRREQSRFLGSHCK